MKKMISLVLALMMVLSLATTAFAADGDPTITVPADGHTYEIYQIFTGDLSEDNVLSNVVWGENGNGNEGGAVAAAVLEALEAVAGSNSNTEKLDIINQYVDVDSDPIATLPKDGEVSAAVAPGYYLIKDKDSSVTGNDSYTTYIVEIVGDVTITRKADVPEVDKVIMDPSEMDLNEAGAGEAVNYVITGTLPTNLADYKEYFYRFNDTLSKGLTYNKDLKVYVVNGDSKVEVTKYF